MAKTLLLADDSSTIRRIVELTYVDTEFRVESFEDGETLLERVVHGEADLVLADLNMPGVAGYDLCRKVKELREVPVLLLAGAFEPLDETLAEQCGADGALVKPFDAEALRSAVLDALERAVAEPEPVSDSLDATADAIETTVDEPTPEWIEQVVDRVIERLSADGVREIVHEATREAVRELAPDLIRRRIQELEDDA
ncbi:MAG: response regulator [Acidobacteriota bacterium]|nr:response regulator [Acidobacteriota bacterium]MDH3785950.1 response regulator [Acidobacteriota bacterium]